MTTILDPIFLYESEKDKTLVWRNPSIGLWSGEVFCFLGFTEPEYDTLTSELLKLVVQDGGSFILEKSLNLSGALSSHEISFFVCNFADGYAKIPKYAVESKLVTPLWLILCHKDCLRYSTFFHPYFKPNDVFSCNSPPFTSMNLLVLGCTSQKLLLAQNGEIIYPHIKVRKIEDKEITKRFLILSGATYHSSYPEDEKELRKISHVVVARNYFKRKKLAPRLKRLNIPIVSLEWLFHIYQTGDYTLQGFHIDLFDFELQEMFTPIHKSKFPQLKHSILDSFFIFLSSSSTSTTINLCKEMGAIEEVNLKVVKINHTGFDGERETFESLINSKRRFVFIVQPYEVMETMLLIQNLSLYLNTLYSSNYLANHFFNFTIASQHWIELCWKMKCLIPETEENGCIHISNSSDLEHHLRSKRRKGQHSLNGLADTIYYEYSD